MEVYNALFSRVAKGQNNYAFKYNDSQFFLYTCFYRPEEKIVIR